MKRSGVRNNTGTRTRRFLFLESFFGGSHKDFAEGLIAHSKHRFELACLPARFWKWRMRGAALYFFDRIPDIGRYDGILATGLMSLSDLKSLVGPHCPPLLAYFHENQLTYPLAPGEHRDFQFGFTDITSALAAERVLFNSKMHEDAFFSELPQFLKMMPDYRPGWVIGDIRRKASMLYPGCHFSSKKTEPAFSLTNPPLIIWNHRWEFDKNPRAFFEALEALRNKGIPFELALLGENFQSVPKEFLSAQKRYAERIVQFGHVDGKKDYLGWLRKGSVVISTAGQENFGIAVVEAVRHGCFPLLPNKLSYPEIIPEKYHENVLYTSEQDLVEKLGHFLLNSGDYGDIVEELSDSMGRYAWDVVIDRYDSVLDELAGLK